MKTKLSFANKKRLLLLFVLLLGPFLFDVHPPAGNFSVTALQRRTLQHKNMYHAQHAIYNGDKYVN